MIYAWDGASRLTSVTAPVTGAVGYLYDGAGRTTRITYPSGRQVNYGYTTRGELASVNGGTALGTTTYSYDNAGRLSGIASPNGVNSTLSYDAANQLLSIGHAKAGGVSQTFAYTYDAAGNRLTATDPTGTTTYGYDNLNQLVTVQPPSPGPATTYGFDPVGNRTSETTGGVATTYTYDAANRVRTRTASGATTTYTYDSNGNRTGKSDSSGLTTYAYNVFDQLTSITAPGGSTVGSYTYNGDGLRTRKTVGMTTTNYAWDITGGLPNVISDGDEYVWGAGLIGRVQPAQGMTPEVATYAHQDGLGSIRLLTDAAGADVGTQRYDAYGAPVAGTGITLPFGFAGEQMDAESGLVYLRARYMDPATGQFLTRDPWSGTKGSPASQHGYGYANNNPTTYSDPTGMATCGPNCWEDLSRQGPSRARPPIDDSECDAKDPICIVCIPKGSCTEGQRESVRQAMREANWLVSEHVQYIIIVQTEAEMCAISGDWCNPLPCRVDGCYYAGLSVPTIPWLYVCACLEKRGRTTGDLVDTTKHELAHHILFHNGLNTYDEDLVEKCVRDKSACGFPPIGTAAKERMR